MACRQPLSEPWPRHQRFNPSSNRDHPEALSAGGVTKRARAIAGYEDTVPQYIATPHVSY